MFGGCTGCAWLLSVVSGCPDWWSLLPAIWFSLNPHLVGGLFVCAVAAIGCERFCNGCVLDLLPVGGV